MASLVEELVTVLEEEEKIYQTLISYGEKKTDILIRADVPELEKLTCLEQLASDDLVTHSNQQVQLLKDIANVLGRTEEKMTVTRLITLLESQPDVQKKLTEARDRLLAAATLRCSRVCGRPLRPPIMTKLPAIQEACWAAADLTQ